MNRSSYISRPFVAALWASALLLVCFTATHARAAGADAAELDKAFARSSLQIASSDGQLHRFEIWIADNDARRARGLMHVRELADKHGMLFLYPRVQRIGMWMKNTFIPLDMLFVRADGRIDSIAHNTTPHSLDTIESQQPVRAVIELKGGAAQRLKIRAGDRVIHPAFGM